MTTPTRPSQDRSTTADTTTGFTPTSEQTQALEAFQLGGSIALHAGAGTGKTSTLRLLTQANPGVSFLYLAYNKAIAEDSRRRFPRNTICNTAHAYALRRLRSTRNTATRSVADPIVQRLRAPRIGSKDLAQWLQITTSYRASDLAVLHPGTQARLAKDMVLRWCHSDDPEITARHLPAVPGIDDHQQRLDLGQRLLPAARRIWADATHTSGSLRTEHDHYLKLFALAHGRWDADVVLLDEAQDSNPCVAGMIVRQHEAGARVIAVGDSAQSIYGWRGAVDAMAAFPAEHRVNLTQSFRFGPLIADEANKWLGLLGSDLRLTGTPTISSTVHDEPPIMRPDAVLCRTNAEAMKHLIDAHLDSVPVAIVGGGADLKSLARAAIELRERGTTSHPDLCAFPSWAAVQEYVDSDGGTDLKTFVRLIDDHGAESVIDAVDRAVDEDHARIVVSTAHRSKGREWKTVHVADDFPVPTENRPVTAEEARLAYVTVTRAQHRLHRGSLKWIDEGHRSILANDLTGLSHGTETSDAPRALATSASATAADSAESSSFQIAVDGRRWQRLSAKLGGEEVAAGWLADVIRNAVDAVLAEAHDQRTDVTGPPSEADAGVPTRERRRPADQSTDFYDVADRTLGIEEADRIRGIIDAAVSETGQQVRTVAANPVELLDQALAAAGLCVTRRDGQIGFSLTVAGERLAASSFGRRYSGRAIMQRIDAEREAL